DITVWDEIFFPFDPLLADAPDPGRLSVEHCPHAESQLIEEAYSCDAGGAVTVAIANRSAGYERSFRLGRWAVPSEPLVPGKGKRPRKRKRAKN
ncbi:MAG: hypothetical protein GY953_11085, partial [bacterium]|nr:hypothetical protein [bacterium]